MNGHRRLAGFADLTELQGLVTLAERESLSAARERTGQRAADLGKVEAVQQHASAQVDAVFAGETLCVDRLRLAASELSSCDRRVADARTSLTEAQSLEETARVACLEAGKRLEWTEARARAAQKKQLSKRDEASQRDAIGLHALKGVLR
jgi:hypothetical protein